MNKFDFVDQIEPTPKLQTKKCKLVAFSIRILLQFTTIVTALLLWYMYDYFVAIAGALLSFVVVGILRAKLRNSVIPPSQREYQYNDQGIADWYSAREICLGRDT